MLIGILLGISLAVFISSSIITLAGFSGLLEENLLTGAIIGPTDMASYGLIVMTVSFIITLLLITFLIKKAGLYA